MADIGAALSAELTRIIDCPYPASLSALAALLARADIPTIRAGIHDRPPCAVTRLATLVYDALPLWPYTSRVLERLCHAPEFRDELLLQNPGFLHNVLTKVNSPQQGFEGFAELCVLLLSRPLPESIPLPTAAQPFFLRVFQRAIRDPNVETVKPVYYMLSGACRQLLSLLPGDTQQQFDNELSALLSSKTAGTDSMLLLWCCGIVLLVEHSENAKAILDPKQPVSTEGLKKQLKTPAAKKLFASKEALYKTINLTCLHVIWALKSGEGVPDDEAVEGIRIASRVMRIIDQDTRESWPKSSTRAGQNFSRFPSKIERVGISQAIQFEAISFYATIAGKKNLPSAVVAQYELCLTKAAGVAEPDCIGETLSSSLPILAPQIRESTIRGLLTDVLEACVSAPPIHQLSNLAIILDELTIATRTSDSLRNTMALALSSNDLHGKLWDFIQANPINDGASCRTHAVSLLHRNLISATIASLLTITLVTQACESALPHDIVIALVNKQRELPPVANHCSHSSVTADRSSISLFQQACTPYTGQHLQDWRDRLNSELESQGNYHRGAIVRSVAQICEDLETRCNTVEEPLRREQERSEGLEKRVAQLLEQISSLESQVTDDGLHLQGLEEEKEVVEKEQCKIAQEKDQIFARLEELKIDFSEANKKSGEVLKAAQDDHKAKELEFRSILLQYEEDRATEWQMLNGTISRLNETQQQKEKEYRTVDEQCENLKRQLSDTEQELDNEHKNASRQTEEITRLETRGFDIETQLHGKEAELEIMTRELSSLQVGHQELIQASEQTLRELEVKYSNDTEVAANKAEEERNALDTQLQSVLQDHQQVKDAYDETRRDIQLLRGSIPPLETRIQELTDLCSEQEEELEELRTLRRNVLASMGLATQNPLAIRSASHSQKEANDSHTPRAPREHRRRKSAILTQDVTPKAATATQGITNTAMENIANASFGSSDSHSSQGGGPTPKRPKPRPSFKVPAMHTPYTQKHMLSSRSVPKKLSPSKRSALRQMSPNRRHTTVGFAIPEQEDELPDSETRSVRKRRGSLQGIEQVDFDIDDEFLAGTPLTQGNFMAGTGRIPEEDDGTITEL